MKILGIGVDIVSNKRIQKLIVNKNFISRIYGKTEINIAKKMTNKVDYYSKRFAAKESFAKCLGTGFRENINFNDIQVVNDKLGKPFYLLSKKIKNKIVKKFKIQKYDIFLSISDERNYSVAFTILQKKLL